MIDHPCITHSLEKVHPADRPRRCYRRGVHFAECQHPDTCRGCVPRTAVVGELCPVCWAKVVDALARVGNLIVHLRSIEKAGQALGERVDTSAANRLIIPEPWTAADGLMDALGAPSIPSTASIDETFRRAGDAVAEWSDPESIVSTREGSKRAVVLVKRVHLALSRWPDSEVDWRKVPLMLCPSCQQATLYRKGPLYYQDELTIECAESHLMYDEPALRGSGGEVIQWRLGYPYCEWKMDFLEWLAVYSKPIEAAFAIHRRAGR